MGNVSTFAPLLHGARCVKQWSKEPNHKNQINLKSEAISSKSEGIQTKNRNLPKTWAMYPPLRRCSFEYAA